MAGNKNSVNTHDESHDTTCYLSCSNCMVPVTTAISEEHPMRRCSHKQAHDTLAIVGDITLLTEKLMSESTGLSGSMFHDDVNQSTHTPGSH